MEDINAMKLLLLSNSTNAGEDYLAWCRDLLRDFFKRHTVTECLFIPYAGVTVHYEDYAERVSEVFSSFGIKVKSIHTTDDPVKAVVESACIVTGGGNTFRLVQQLHEKGLMSAIRAKVIDGTPFIGWSAGANVACPTMRTTNDMPIIQPASFNTLNLIPFQINPHYLDAHPEGHGGETREQRIIEFLELNRLVTVVGLREACALSLEAGHLNLLGKKPMRVFRYHTVPMECEVGSDLDFLLYPAS
jgi:dipeptidase E